MTKRIGYIFDAHLPFEDIKSYQLTLDIFEDIEVNEIVLGGDYADIYSLTAHAKNPEIEVDFQFERDYVCDNLYLIRNRFPKVKITFIEGNHEYRLVRYLSNHATDLFGIVTVPQLFRLKQLNIDFVPYGPYQAYTPKGSNLIVRHEPLVGGKFPVMGSMEKSTTSIMFGHIHRPQEGQMIGLQGNRLKAYSIPCLCDIRHPVMQYVKNHHQWSHGFGIETIFGSLSNVDIVDIHHVNGKRQAFFEGNLYEI